MENPCRALCQLPVSILSADKLIYLLHPSSAVQSVMRVDSTGQVCPVHGGAARVTCMQTGHDLSRVHPRTSTHQQQPCSLGEPQVGLEDSLVHLVASRRD